jgi:hypothetical protein
VPESDCHPVLAQSNLLRLVLDRQMKSANLPLYKRMWSWRMQTATTDEVLVGRDGSAGTIRLNRPRALNSLPLMPKSEASSS